MNSQFEKILPVLVKNQVDFILVGGVAAIVHGSSRATFDVDIVYGRAEGNLKRMAGALKDYLPYLRGAPPGLPFVLDEQTLRNGLNFTLTTTLGDLDLLGEITGGGGLEQLLPHTITAEAFGVQFHCLSLEHLIRVKIAAGRPKDHEGVAELQIILRERNKQKPE